MKKQMPVFLLILALCVFLSGGMAKADVVEMEYWEEFLYTHYEDCDIVNTYYTVNHADGEAKVFVDVTASSRFVGTVQNGEEIFIEYIYHDENGVDWGFWLDYDAISELHSTSLWILMSDVYDPENPPEDLVLYEKKETSHTEESSKNESSGEESSEKKESSRSESSEEEESSENVQPGSGNGITLAIVISAVVLVMLISGLVLVLIKDR